MSGPGQPNPMVLLGLALLLGAALLCAYSPAFRAGYVYDDSRLIIHNPFLEGPLDWNALFFDRQSVAPDAQPDIYRPISTLSFFVENRLGNGSPLVHHAAGLGFHLLNSLLFFYFLLRLLAVMGMRSRREWAAWFGAALFALHPVQVESVAWISSRSGQISALFILLAIIAAVGRSQSAHAPRPVASSLAVILFVGAATFLACLARESGVMTGAFILISALCLKPLRKKTVFACGLVALGAALLYVALRFFVMDGAVHQVPPHGGGWGKNFLYGAYGCFYQVGLLFRPWFHNLDYQDGFFDALPTWEVSAGACAYVLLIALAILSVRRHPLAACGILLFAAAQLPTSSLVITVRSLVNDRYLYLPLMGIGLFLCGSLSALDRRSLFVRKAASALAVALLLVLAMVTHDRSRDWIDSKSLWTAALKTHPGSIRAHVALSKAALQEGDADGALKFAVAGYTIGRRGTAVRMNAMYKATQALTELGRDAERENLLEELLAEASHPERSEDFRLFQRAGLELFELKVRAARFDEAAQVMENLIRHDGPTPRNLYRLGIVLEHAGRFEEAEDAFLCGAALTGDFADIHFRLAELYEGTGRIDLAREERRKGRAAQEKEKERRKQESTQLKQ